MVSTSSRTFRRSARMALASAADSSKRSCRSRCSLMRSEASAISMSLFSMKCQTRASFRLTSSSSVSTVSSRLRCSAAIPSISSSTTLTNCVMLLSVRMLSRIRSTTSSSKRRAFSLGESQAPLPCLIRDWQT